jgi:hypothetical protein
MTTTTDRKCVICSSTDREPNWAVNGTQTCEGHHERLARALEVIPWQWSILSAAPKTGKGGARVSGSSEQSLGVSVPVLDLMGPANSGTVHDVHGDQVGMVSVASILDGWVADWVDTRGKGETRPVSTVGRLTDWLAKRLDWAVREHPALEDFAADIRRTVAALKAANGDLPQEDVHKDGIECARCDLMALYEVDDFIECDEGNGGCGKLLTPSEYAQWVELKGFFLRATICCPDCGETALAGAHKLDKVECVRAKGGCGLRLTWKQYTKTALTERRPERAEWAVA